MHFNAYHGDTGARLNILFHLLVWTVLLSDDTTLYYMVGVCALFIWYVNIHCCTTTQVKTFLKHAVYYDGGGTPAGMHCSCTLSPLSERNKLNNLDSRGGRTSAALMALRRRRSAIEKKTSLTLSEPIEDLGLGACCAWLANTTGRKTRTLLCGHCATPWRQAGRIRVERNLPRGISDAGGTRSTLARFMTAGAAHRCRQHVANARGAGSVHWYAPRAHPCDNDVLSSVPVCVDFAWYYIREWPVRLSNAGTCHDI